MGADSSAKNTPNAPEFICPICLPHAQKFWISMKKGFLWRPQSVIVPMRISPLSVIVTSLCINLTHAQDTVQYLIYIGNIFPRSFCNIQQSFMQVGYIHVGANPGFWQMSQEGQIMYTTLSFYRLQNVLGWSKYFVTDQKLIYILCQSQTFCARLKDNFHICLVLLQVPKNFTYAKGFQQKVRRTCPKQRVPCQLNC